VVVSNTHMTTTEVAAAAGVHANTVLNAIKRGDLAAERIGGRYLIRRSELEEFVKRYKPHLHRES